MRTLFLWRADCRHFPKHSDVSSVAKHFEWDERKAVRNQQKHAISFEEVRSLFTSGIDYLEIYDANHSLDEDRFICIGPIATGIVLVVIVEVEEDVVRIISARRVTARESQLYIRFIEERLR
ncbi:MAG: BrnT family toxin [Planctomycetia bacterium]